VEKNKKEYEMIYQKRIRSHVRKNKKCFFPELESELNDFIIAKRREGVCLGGFAITNQARLIAQNKGYNEFVGIYKKKFIRAAYYILYCIYENRFALFIFKGSKGWLNNFLHRHYTLRRITSMGRDLPLDAANIAKNFIKTCKQETAPLNRSQVLGGDHTSIKLDTSC
jgi:hypothetical protein